MAEEKVQYPKEAVPAKAPDADHRYNITYKFDVLEKGLTAEEVEKDKNLGACDSYVLISFVGEPATEGPLLTIVNSGCGLGHKDGEQVREMTPGQYFTTWLMLTNFLMRRLPKKDPRKGLLETVWEVATSPIRKPKKEG